MGTAKMHYLDTRVEDRALTLTTSQSQFSDTAPNRVDNQRESVRHPKPPGPATLHPLPGDNSCVEPPDPIPNSEVKRNRADGSVAQAMQE